MNMMATAKVDTAFSGRFDVSMREVLLHTNLQIAARSYDGGQRWFVRLEHPGIKQTAGENLDNGYIGVSERPDTKFPESLLTESESLDIALQGICQKMAGKFLIIFLDRPDLGDRARQVFKMPQNFRIR